MVQKTSVEDLLELSSHVMNYAVIEERLMEPLRKKWEVAKKTRLEYYAANINPECWVQCKQPKSEVTFWLKFTSKEITTIIQIKIILQIKKILAKLIFFI